MLVCTTYCDRCSERIESDRTELLIECGPLLQRGRESIDLCRDCLDAVMLAIDRPAPAMSLPPAPGPLAGRVGAA